MNLVIAIAGPPGSGKSTLVTELAERLDQACIISCDDYQMITDRPIEEITEWASNGGNYNEFVIPQLSEDLERLKNGETITDRSGNGEVSPAPYILFETLFGREHQESARFIDLLVWIDVPMDLALARKVKSFTGMFLSEAYIGQCAENMTWLDNYLTSYMSETRQLLVMQRERIAASADVIVNGQDDVDSVVNQIVEAISKSL